MKAMNIKDRVQAIIQRQRLTLQEEIDTYRKKMYDTESYWGFGGPYSRQEAAAERREAQLKELDDFEEQLKHVKKHQNVSMYIFGCRNCGSITMTSVQPFDDWHECPACRQMVHLRQLPSTDFQIIDTGEVWMEQLRKLAQEGR